jgi:hypothetical protein
MAAIELRVDISTLIDAVLSGNSERVISSARELLAQERNADVLIGRFGIIATKGNPEEHVIVSLAATAMLARLLRTRPAPLETETPEAPQSRALPLFVRALHIANEAIKKGVNATVETPKPFFPSELIDQDITINEKLAQAISAGDSSLVESILLGFYGTGADYRTLQIRAYEALSTTFFNDGHPLIDTVRGFELLDSVEWAKNVPPLLHWLSSYLPQHPGSTVPSWVQDVQSFITNHDLTSIRTRLSAPKNTNALPLRQVILSDANTVQVLQATYDALIQGEASPRSVAAVIALAAAEFTQKVSDDNRELFIQASQGLLFASAASTIFRQVQDVEAYNLLFTTAAYVNALYKELVGQLSSAPKTQVPSTSPASTGGGLIAVSQLETLEAQLKNQDFKGALGTADRYIKLGHNAKALFGTIGLGAARNDASIDDGASLRIVYAAASEFLSWPRDLASTSYDAFLHIALRAAAFGTQDSLISQLEQ